MAEDSSAKLHQEEEKESQEENLDQHLGRQ